MNFIGNIIWIIFGGFATALEYFCAGLALCVTIIGIPFGLQLFKLGILALLPFGQKSVHGSSSAGAGCFFTLLNILWMFTGGLIIALTHLLFGILLSITIIGIPFGRQHFKLMSVAFTPFGRDIVSA
ncbi:MAG: YccF domain-containing protein [Rikenellaceae bacterium]